MQNERLSSLEALDNPIWNALNTRQVGLADIADLARRFQTGVTTLAGFAEPTRESYDSLASIVGVGERVGLFLDETAGAPANWSINETAPLLQMVHDGRELGAVADSDIHELTAADTDEMVVLAELTKPGPFGTRTREMGGYLGIRDKGGGLIAMAGERLHLPGLTEVSAVCTHPDHLGRGYAATLMAEVMRRITERGEVPFLHVRESNTRAVGLYERLGYTTRRIICYTDLLRVS